MLKNTTEGMYSTKSSEEIWNCFLETMTRDNSRKAYMDVMEVPTTGLKIYTLNLKVGYTRTVTNKSLAKYIAILIEQYTKECVFVSLKTFEEKYNMIEASEYNVPKLYSDYSGTMEGGSASADLEMKIATSKDYVEKSLYVNLIKDLTFEFPFDLEHCQQVDPFPSNEEEGKDSKKEESAYLGNIKFSEIFDITKNSGYQAAGNGIHSGHQTRIVQTKNALYTAYVTNTWDKEVEGQKYLTNTYVALKIEKDGTVKHLLTDDCPADSSSVNVIRDPKTEDVYVVVVPVDKYAEMKDNTERTWTVMYRVDAKTDEVEKVFDQMCFTITKVHGYGYSQPIMDWKNRKIYVIYSGGDDPGYIAWVIYDMEKHQWEKEVRTIQIDFRDCYHYIYADGKGGVRFVTQRAMTTIRSGHPEIKKANYVWDRLDLIVIPDMYQEKFETYCVAPANYSRAGENRYPNTRVYDAFVDSNDLMHVFYAEDFYRLPSRNFVEYHLYHVVYDGGREIFREPFELQGNFALKMIQTLSGQHYVLALPKGAKNFRPQVWKATDEKGLHYTFECAHTYEGAVMTCNPSLTGPRSNSLQNDREYCWTATSGANGKYDVWAFSVSF